MAQCIPYYHNSYSFGIRGYAGCLSLSPTMPVIIKRLSCVDPLTVAVSTKNYCRYGRAVLGPFKKVLLSAGLIQAIQLMIETLHHHTKSVLY